MKYLVMGLPGSGKTTFATKLAPAIGAVLFDGDEVRRELWSDLGYEEYDRIEQAHRMGRLCDIVNRAGIPAIAAFVCPTRECRRAFGLAVTIWIDRIKESRFADTNALFVPPAKYNFRLMGGSVDDWVKVVTRETSWLRKTC